MGNFSRVVVVLILLFTACSRVAEPDVQRVAAPAPMPLARTEVAGTQWRGDIVVVGGLMKDGRASARADRYVPSKNRWEPLPPLPVGLHHTAATEFLARVWVIGGYTIDQAQWRESARAFSLGVDERAWREEPPLPASRGTHAAGRAAESHRRHGWRCARSGVGRDGDLRTGRRMAARTDFARRT